MTLPRIECAICNKKVDKIEIESNLITNGIVFKVECHGETDRCELKSHVIFEFLSAAVVGTAFTRKRLDVH